MFLGATYEQHDTPTEAGQNYSTGNASFTLGSPTVNGVATVWVAGMEGGLISYDADGIWCKIDTVVNNTEITLFANYTGDGGGVAAYRMMPSLAWEGSSEGTTTLDFLFNIRNSLQRIPIFGGIALPIPNTEWINTWFRVITLRFYFMEGAGYTMFYWIVLFPFAMLGILSLIMLFISLVRGNISWGG